ncbi:dienelactone hydrolase family protein [Paenibacillus sp. JDR-2]|uniref:dienelactone hydrolase family protein n=1 Tax=Paenibacillus sp. (strain JDR-2) TaxID=324057 RepID=UPI0001AAF86F|nr:dienelactone hydrolase family protein [Paenibacillus sp. JDR-2]ACT01602.1 dienelactone hydrolase [Paenibacillus sp. JDR-2]
MTMIEIKQHSDKAIIVVHEIYGLNSHISSVCTALAAHGYDAYAPDLLDRKLPFGYEQEQEAYGNFMEHAGFDQVSTAILRLAGELKPQYRQVILVGFSIGATASWLCSTSPDISAVVGYYGSRIRSYAELNPGCPVLLFYPETEPSFDVDQLMDELRVMKQVITRKFSGNHGFADPYSARYVQASADEAFAQMVDFLESIG